MTESNDGSAGTDGGGDDEAVDADEDLDALQPISTSLRPAQNRGHETAASADVAENDRENSEQSDPDAPAADPDGLDEPAPVSSSLQSAQSRAGASDADNDDSAGDVDVGASNAVGSHDRDRGSESKGDDCGA